MKITLCGSARFEEWFKHWNEMLSLAGHTVYSLSVYPSDKAGKKSWYDDEQKRVLDKVHLDKIKNSDAILVLNVFGYIGESTLREIDFAKSQGKTLYALESWGEGLGICHGHTELIKKAARKYDTWGKFSPIDTSYPNFRDVYTGDEILGPAGKLRSMVATADKLFELSIFEELPK